MENDQYTLSDEEKMKALREMWKNLDAKGFYEPEIDNPMGYSLESAEDKINAQPIPSPTPLPVEPTPITFGQKYQQNTDPVKRLPEDTQKSWRDIFKR